MTSKKFKKKIPLTQSNFSNRNSAVEFSFFVLADSGAFITQAPARITPSDLVFRPFTYQVWLSFGAAFLAVIVILLGTFYVAKAWYFE